MKTKKLLAILLSALMVMSFCISAGAAGDRTESVMLKKGVEDFSEGVFDADDGTYGTAGYFGTGSAPSNTPAADANTTLSIGNEEGRGNYAKVNTTTSSNGQYAARMIFQNTFGISETKAIGIECKFRLPSKMTNGTATSDSTNVSVWISDNIYGRNRSNVMNIKKVGDKWGFYNIDKYTTLIQALELDKWYGIRVEYITLNSQSLARYRISIFDEKGNFLAQAISSQTGRATRELGMISFGQNATDAEFHVDDFYAYSFNASDFNFGSTIFREGFDNYWTIDEASNVYTYSWGETKTANGDVRGNSINCSNPSADKRVNVITDEGSTNKFFRMKSTQDDSGYIQTRIDVASAVKSMDNNTTYYSDAYVYGAKVRVNDTSKENAIELWSKTVAYTGTDETVYSAKEVRLALIEPDIKAVTIGDGKNVSFNLEMESDVWYDLKLYYNDLNGYGRLEMTNTETNKTQVFEGNYAKIADVDLKTIGAYGFLTRFADGNIVDYDDLTVTVWNPNAASMAKVYDAGAITLSKEAIEAGEIKATVDITGYSQAKDITTEVANLVFVSYEGDRLSEIEFVGVKPNTYTAEATLTIPEEGAENYKVKAMLWGDDMSPIVESVALGNWE